MLPQLLRVRLLLLNFSQGVAQEIHLHLDLVDAGGLLGELGVESFELCADAVDDRELALHCAQLGELLQHPLLQRLHLVREEAHLRVRLECRRGRGSFPKSTHLRSGITQINPRGSATVASGLPGTIRGKN